ncbi:MAG: zinc-binding dehydrogenase [Candidatus Fermentithermobacillus carboniphilus]|uniref:Zinc-binding dehydrogenase n=1 Tax=Candidatus Fermentithermobacillus carboniphilus TaxID=3085328 RepID=A0AAT9LAQ7_9FIRM|nr:MAG: zinc-binding dehydrogenase [Candidatus Fermentithermobacillus carboniphilus]
MSEKMKVAVMEDVRKMAVWEMDVPEVGPGMVLAKIYRCNICTTDWQTWAGLRASQGRKFPWAPGHEMSGEIVAVGEGVRQDLKPGMRVGFGSQGSRGCGQCIFCRKGHPSRCINKPKELERSGVTGSFGMAQYFLVEATRVYRLADDLPFEQGGYLEPVATVVHGMKRLRVQPGDDVVVIGAGNLGLVNAQVARVYGGRVMVSEISDERCGIAKSLGFEVVNPATEDLKKRVLDFTGGKGADAVILAVGSTKANQQALEILAPMARVLLFAAGYPAPELPIDPNTVHYREWEFIGTFSADPADFEVAAKLLSERQVRVEKMISYTVPIDDVQRAFELAATPGNYRVSLSMWDQ